MIFCLAHDVHTNKPNGCPKSDTCARHLYLRHNQVAKTETLMGSACSSMDYNLYWPIEEVKEENNG